MKPARLIVATAFGLAALLVLNASAYSQDRDDRSPVDSGSPGEVDRPQVRQPGSPSDDDPRGGRHRGPRSGFGPGSGRGPGSASGKGNGGEFRGRQGDPKDGDPQVGRPGMKGPFGGRGMGRPSGPPRWPHHNWESMEKSDPEMFKLFSEDHSLERLTRELAMQYRQAPKEKKEEIKKQLAETVDKHFEVRQKRRLLELERLEEELKRLKESIDRRTKARKDIVGRRTSQLLGEDDLSF